MNKSEFNIERGRVKGNESADMVSGIGLNYVVFMYLQDHDKRGVFNHLPAEKGE